MDAGADRGQDGRRRPVPGRRGIARWRPGRRGRPPDRRPGDAGQPQEATSSGATPRSPRWRPFVDAVAAAPAALLLEGEPGIGKTTLWRSARAAAADARAPGARGHRRRGRGGPAVRRAARPVRVRRPDAALALPAAAARRARRRAAALADPRAVADQHAVCVAALGIIRTLAARAAARDRRGRRRLAGPLVGPGAALRRAAGWPPSRSGCSPPGARGSAAPLGLDGPPLDARLHHVALGPLDPDADPHAAHRALRAARCPAGSPAASTPPAAGNPFSAVEIGRTLLARGERILDEDALPLPGGVLRVTAERIAALSPAAQQALAVVAVSAGASPALLTAALGDDAVDALDEAVGEGLLQVDGSAVRFAHPLMRSAAAAESDRARAAPDARQAGRAGHRPRRTRRAPGRRRRRPGRVRRRRRWRRPRAARSPAVRRTRRRAWWPGPWR